MGRKTPARADLTGQTFGQLTVVSFLKVDDNRQAVWRCQCACGKTTTVTTNKLRTGNTKSCGCGSDKTRFAETHGLEGSPTYKSWQAMLSRCNDLKRKYYAMRGVTVCDRWMSFENFLADMGERPQGTTLDRHPNGDGNYEPDNCRWATPKEQTRNRRANVWLTYQGRTQCVLDWQKELGLNSSTIYNRLKRGVKGDNLFKPANLSFYRKKYLPKPAG